MADEEIPVGKRYSLVYEPITETTKDSEKFRRRLAAALSEFVNHHAELYPKIEVEIGINPPSGSYVHQWRKFCATIELGELLDTVTVVGQFYIERLNKAA